MVFCLSTSGQTAILDSVENVSTVAFPEIGPNLPIAIAGHFFVKVTETMPFAIAGKTQSSEKNDAGYYIESITARTHF